MPGKGNKIQALLVCSCLPLQPWAGRNPVLVGREKEKAVDWGNGEQRGARTSLHSGTVQPVLDVYYQHSFATVPSPVQHHKFAWSLRGCFWVPASTGQAGVVTVTWVLLSLSSVEGMCDCLQAQPHLCLDHSNTVYFTRDEKLGEKHLCLA